MWRAEPRMQSSEDRPRQQSVASHRQKNACLAEKRHEQHARHPGKRSCRDHPRGGPQHGAACDLRLPAKRRGHRRIRINSGVALHSRDDSCHENIEQRAENQRAENGERQVALRADGSRLVAVDDVASSVGSGETIEVPEGGVVLVTGGARGVTASSALALAKQHGLRLALLGRTPLRDAAADEPTGTTATEIATALAAAARARGEQLSLPQARAHAEALLAEREVRQTLATAERQGTPARYFPASITDE